MIGNELSKL